MTPSALGLRAAEANRGSEAAALTRSGFAVGASRIGELELDVDWRPEAEHALARLRVRNRGARPRQIHAVLLGFEWKDWRARALRYLKHGWQSWSYTGSRELDAAGEPAFPSGPWLRGMHHAQGAPPADRAGWHESHLVMALGGAPGPVCCVGVEESGRSFAVVYARREGDTLRIEVEWQVDAELAPGAVLDLEPVRVALGDDASALLEAYAEDYGRRAGARVSRPFVAGWCSWYYAFHDVREADVLRNLDALAARRSEIPVDLVLLDDGFQRAIGDWLVTNAKFPRGLAPLSEAIRAAGFAPGLWTAPFCAVEQSELFAKHPDWWLRAPDGSGELLRGLLHPQWSADGAVYVLDPGVPAVLAHLENLFAELAGMGFQYLKLDFLYTAALSAAASDPALGRAARLRRGLEAIRAGAGEESFLLGCGCPLGAAVGVVDAMRIGPDVAPHWLPDPAHCVPGLEEVMPATRSALRSALARTFMHRRLWSNDPDCLLVRAHDTQLSQGERDALAAVIATTGGVALFSEDLPRLGDAERAALAATLDTAQRVDTAGLPGVMQVPELLAAEIPSRVEADDGADAIVALLNERERSGRLTVAPSPCRLAVFCDFDGTFSQQDVGATLALRYGGPRRPEVWARYERGEIQAWDYNLEILDGLDFSERDLETFLRSEVDLDPGARPLLAWCSERRVPFRIVSDGFDWNLNRLQAIHGVSFAYSANHLRYELGRWRIRAGGPDPRCGCGTGTCKRAVIEAFRAGHPHALLVHIGNGRVSDTCGALAADVAFAKDSLAGELERRGVAYEAFETLLDVIPRLDALLRPQGAGGAAAGDAGRRLR